MPKAVNVEKLIGTKVNHITVLKEVERGKHNFRQILCRCDCGNEFVTQLSSVTSSRKIKTCFPCSRKTIKYAVQATRKHGEAQKTRLYNIWAAMKRRCYNPNNEHYDRYGGRGITVCEEWKEYIPFREWAMSNGYKDKLSIDRIDNNGNYCPENCRWVTMEVQQNNRCNSIKIKCDDGQERTIKQLSLYTGLNETTLYERRRKNPMITYNELVRKVK